MTPGERVNDFSAGWDARQHRACESENGGKLRAEHKAADVAQFLSRPTWHADEEALNAETDPEIRRLCKALTDGTTTSTIDRVIACRQLIERIRSGI